MNEKEIGLIFDMDGVIVDNHEFHFLAWQQLASKRGISISEEFYRENMNGRTIDELVRVVFQLEVSKEEAREIGREKEETYRELYREKRTAMKGLIPFLEAAKDLEIPMIVGTSAPYENVTYTLDDLDLRKYFLGVVDDSMVAKGKPDPEVYLKCASAIDRDPANCIVFEDAVSGIKAGKSAGAKVIALATSHKREELSADLIIDDFENFSMSQVKAVLGI
ncbi:HAD family phosphatase [Marinoscillum sp. MHG1-6]|uniref:HAD family hydrolase n=1 Tax=Marinoscillum sp. MHG1-6 TaxID=2959627 RepID=UPI002157901A|nr:HAD family phosphatase [Marinoscillum sp. MHG1-6]